MILLSKRLGAFERLGQVLKNDCKAFTAVEEEAVLTFEKAKQKAMAKKMPGLRTKVLT